MTNEKHLSKNRFRYGIARHTAFVSGLLLLLLSTLLIANYIQTRAVDPLNSPALENLRLQFQQNPDDADLAEQIRALDMLARKAYFTQQWQLEVGGYLLFGLALIWLVSLKSVTSLRRQFPDLTHKNDPEMSIKEQFITKRSFAYAGLTLFLLALGAAWFGETAYRSKTSPATGPEKEKSSQEPTFDRLAFRSQWPGFRGPEGNGIVYGNDNLPLSWDGASGKNILWKTPIPLSGFNSPIIWDERIFLSGADDDHLAVFCFDAEKGALLWQTELDDIPGSPHPRPKVVDYTGYAAPSMTTDGERVFVMFGTGDIACLDFSGKRLWARNLGSPANHYGHSSSLLLYGSILLVQFDQNTTCNLLGLDVRTGDELYNTKRDTKISWASPILIQVDDREQVVLSANPFVIGYDPLSGSEFWRISCMSGEVGPSPCFGNGLVFVCNDYARLAAFKPGPDPKILWQSEDDLSDVSSPVANKDIVVMAASFGTASCFDAQTGEKNWYYDAEDGFYSSPIIAGDKIFLMDTQGIMHIIRASKTFELIATNPLGEKAFSTPAFHNNRIFIRGEHNLIGIGAHD